MRFVASCCLVFVPAVLFAQSPLQEHTLTFRAPEDLASFVGPRTSHRAVSNGTYLYILGGYRWETDHAVFYPTVQVARINQDGTLAAWNPTSEMSVARTGLASACVNGIVYAAGGSDENWTTLGSVECAPIQPDGTLGEWATHRNTLNVPRSNFDLIAHVPADGRTVLYAVGGVGQVGLNTVHFDSVEYAEILDDGTLSEWKLASFDMKGGRSTPASFVWRNRIYVCGGWGDRNFDDVFSDVQFASLASTGDLNAWQTNPYDLRMRLYGHTASTVTDGSECYVITVAGSLGEGNVVEFLQYARIAEDGSVGPWIMSQTRIDQARWGHSSVAIGDRIYVTGGSASGNVFFNDVQLLAVETRAPECTAASIDGAPRVVGHQAGFVD